MIIARLFPALLILSTGPLAAQGLESLVSPGTLSRAHANLSGLDNCQRCHTPGEGVTSSKCLSCHTEIAERIREGRGLHREEHSDNCQSCHPEHRGEEAQMTPWDPTSFDHAETGYRLEGFHSEVKACDQCHTPERSQKRETTKSFLLRSDSCTTCHNDAHKGVLGPGCERCHSVKRHFKSVDFDHSRAAFPLRGAHAKVACSRCHVDSRWKGIAFSQCLDCHANRHRPSLGSDCTQCHTVSSWKIADASTRFHQAGSAFPLRGGHAEVACSKCHLNGQFKGIAFQECRNCHTSSPHQGQFSQDCKSCHTEDNFTKTTFRHESARFRLNGKHLGVACSKCHPREKVEFAEKTVAFTRYRPLSTECRACHDDIHLGQFSQPCAKCHSTGGFGLSQISFSHNTDSDFVLKGSHIGLVCGRCHKSERGTFPAGFGQAVRFLPISPTCETCHPDQHGGQLGDQCASCHTVEHFKPASGFNHRMARFQLTGKHQDLPCADCHPRVKRVPSSGETLMRTLYRPLRKECSSCHKDPHRRADQASCDECHTSKTFEVRNFNHFETSFALMGRHASLACERCHTQTNWNGKVVLTFAHVRRECQDCHKSPHRSRYGECGRCHVTTTWVISDF